jgi:ribosomal-protein-alanine N-acetyltransferase
MPRLPFGSRRPRPRENGRKRRFDARRGPALGVVLLEPALVRHCSGGSRGGAACGRGYFCRVLQLEILGPDHASEVLAFELANRTYFAGFVSDRGDAFFDEFSERYDELLADREARREAYYVLVDDDGTVLGRFNLYGIEGDAAEVGYRVAERIAGQGVATAAVRELCRLAATKHGVRRLRARTTHENVASQRVLTKAGFVAAGETDVAGRSGIWFERMLTQR